MNEPFRNQEDSVTAWIGELKDGKDDASQKLWERSQKDGF